MTRAAVPAPAADAEVLLAHLLGVERAVLHRDPGRSVPPVPAAAFAALVARRAAREPLQYLTGRQEFWSLEFRVTPAVLIPRPETEGIIEAFLERNRRPDPLVLDVGTGSGCLAVAVAREIPGARVLAGDLSEEALAIARDNARRHGVGDRIRFERGDLLEPFRAAGIAGQADFILCNPPYVPAGAIDGLSTEVRDFEPRVALAGGPDGLDLYRRLAAGAPEFLRPAGGEEGAGAGLLIVEFGIGQVAGIRSVFGSGAGWEVIEVRADLAGLPRVAVLRPGG